MAKLGAHPRSNPRGGASEAVDGRTLILDTAARLFSEEGYSAVSLRDIAGACGMKAASLYYHFASKEEIVVEVLRIGVERVFEEVRRTIMRLPADTDARSLLNAGIRAHLSALLEQHDYTSANVRIFSQVPRSARELLVTVRDNYEAYWTSLLARCAEIGKFSPGRNLHLARLFLLGTLNGSLEWYQPGLRSVEHIADELTSIFLTGLLGRPDENSGLPTSDEGRKAV